MNVKDVSLTHRIDRGIYLGFVSLRDVAGLVEAKFNDVYDPKLLTQVLGQLTRGNQLSKKNVTMRSWVDYQLFVPLVTANYYFFRGYKALEQDLQTTTTGSMKDPKKDKKKKGKKPERQIDLREFRLLLKRCAVRLTDQEIHQWFATLDQFDGGKQGDGKVLLDRSLHYIASMSFPWSVDAAPLGYEPQAKAAEPGVKRTKGGRGMGGGVQKGHKKKK